MAGETAGPTVRKPMYRAELRALSAPGSFTGRDREDSGSQIRSARGRGGIR